MQRAHHSRNLLASVAAVLVLLAAAACSTGTDADDPGDVPTVQSTEPTGSTGGTDAGQTDEVPYWGTAAEMECVEEHPNAVDLGDTNLQDNPSQADLVGMVEVLLECIGDPAASPGVRSMVISGLERATRGLRMSDDEGACIVEEVIGNADDPALALIGGGGESDISVMDDAFEACLTAENLDLVSGTAGAGPQDYGDDARLDSIWDDCGAGDMRACDLLYFQVPTGSAYEQHAETCGGTDSDVSTFCSEDTDVDDSWILDPNSPAALTLVADCEAGDFTACDLLYQIAPVGSDLENWGSTCATRVNSAALPDCRTLLG